MKAFTSVRGLGRTDLESLVLETIEMRRALDRGAPLDQSLEGVCVANLFFEPSTRTRLSFDLATQRLGGHVITFFPESSSATKGESLRDTVLTVGGIGADILVVRHRMEGIPASVGEWTGLPVVNAGDGANEHPSQALVDAATIHQHFDHLEGLRMAIIGDVAHSRVAGSLIHAMATLGVDLTLVGPEEWLPAQSALPKKTDIDTLVGEIDVAYLLRVQTERGGVISNDYVDKYGLDSQRAARMSDRAVIMHPGPINRGVEIADQVADSPRSLIVEQVRNGVPARMVILRALAKGRP
ncbi:MAG TPA: aspartate carbamoyltransferase catalytic subunit [Acidimicrobiia bacterium]|nr:aspartate carbamoyltransferase catalytic subunit [Acidimicrobiia bacterium]